MPDYADKPVQKGFFFTQSFHFKPQVLKTDTHEHPAHDRPGHVRTPAAKEIQRPVALRQTQAIEDIADNRSS